MSFNYVGKTEFIMSTTIPDEFLTFLDEFKKALKVDSDDINHRIDNVFTKLAEQVAQYRADQIKAAELFESYIGVINASFDKLESDIRELDEHVDEVYDILFEDDEETCEECGQPLQQHEVDENDGQ